MCESACEMRKAREEAARELRGCGKSATSCENRLARFAELDQFANLKRLMELSLLHCRTIKPT
jgi:hypothetical protein